MLIRVYDTANEADILKAKIAQLSMSAVALPLTETAVLTP